MMITKVDDAINIIIIIKLYLLSFMSLGGDKTTSKLKITVSPLGRAKCWVFSSISELAEDTGGSQMEEQ